MAICDSQVDDAIALVLETQTIVSTRQKATVWEQVRQQAAQQVMLAPYAVPPSPPVPRHARLYQNAIGFVRSCVVILIDDRVYRRAAALRHVVCMTQTIGGEVVAHYDVFRPVYHHEF